MTPEAPKVNNSIELFTGNYWPLPTDIGLVGAASEAFGARLDSAGWDADEASRLQMAFGEALVNAMAHGNLGIPKQESSAKLLELARERQAGKSIGKKVFVSFEINGEKVVVKIRDEGDGFKSEDVPDPTADANLMGQTGRGVFLMKKFFDSVAYNEKGNEVTMIKNKEKTV